MSDLVARLRLEADASNLVSGATQGAKSVDSVGAAATGARPPLQAAANDAKDLSTQLGEVGAKGQTAQAGLKAASGESENLGRKTDGVNKAVEQLKGVLEYLGVKELIGQIQEAAFVQDAWEGSFQALGESAIQAKDDLAFVREESGRLGLGMKAAVPSFTAFAQATKGSAIEGEATRQVWLAMSGAGVALNLSNDKLAGSQKALAKVATEGRVTLQDLRGELSNNIPRAVEISAAAMGMSQAEFLKTVKAGKVLSDDFLPKFADQLNKEFGPALEQSLNSPLGRARVELSATQDGFEELEAVAGRGFLSGATEGLHAFNSELTNGRAQEAAREIGHDIGEALGAAAQVASFLAEHLDLIVSAGQAVVGVGLAVWLAQTAQSARLSAAAFLSQALAVETSTEASVTGAAAQATAQTTIFGAVRQAAAAELQAATAAAELAAAQEAAAAAAVAQARAQIANISSSQTYAQRTVAVAAAEGELAAATTAATAAMARQELAAGAYATAMTTAGAAAGAAGGLFGGLVAMLGGPVGIALIGATAAVALLTTELNHQKEEAAAAAKSQEDYSAAMAEASATLKDAGVNTVAWGLDTANAKGPTDDLAASTHGLANETFRLADARRQAAVAALQESLNEVRAQQKKLDTQEIYSRAASGPNGPSFEGHSIPLMVKVPVGTKADGSPLMGNVPIAAARADLGRKAVSLEQAMIASSFAPPDPKQTKPTIDWPGTSKKAAGAKGPDTAEQLRDLERLAQAQNDYRTAVAAGGAAVDELRVKQAGQQALDKSGLDDKPKQTAAERERAQAIVSTAEALERAKISNERFEKAMGLQRTLAVQTRALEDEAIAAGKGEAALEAYRVKQAGLQVVQQLGIETLDQLSAQDRKAAEAAIAAAEAKEKQAIATDKATKVAAAARDLDDRITVEQRNTAAVVAGTKAEVDYARAEFIRQEVEKAGKTLTADQIALLTQKADLLFKLKGLTQSAGEARDYQEQLKQLQMTNSEREVEVRTLEIEKELLQSGAVASQEAATAQAHALALAEQQAKETAAAIGDLKNAFRDDFINTGKLSADKLGEYFTKRLRQAVYDALLAKPIDIIINASVNLLTQELNKIMGSLGGSGSSGGSGFLSGLGGLFKSQSDQSYGENQDLVQALGGVKNSVDEGVQTSAQGFGQMGGALQGLGAIFAGYTIGTGLSDALANAVGLHQKADAGGQLLEKGYTAAGAATGFFIAGPIGAAIGGIIAGIQAKILGSVFGPGVTPDALSEVVVKDGKFVTGNSAVDDKGPSDQINQLATGVAEGLNNAFAALGLDASKVSSLYTTVGYIEGDQLKKLQAGYYGGAISGQGGPGAAGGSKGSATDDLWASREKGVPINGVADASAVAQAIIKDTLIKALEEGAGDLSEAAKTLLKNATDLDEAIAQINLAKTFEKSIDDAILQITDPAAYAKQQALDSINANYDALKAQGQKLLQEGLISADVLAKLDHMKDLEIDKALQDLAGSASGAASSLQDWLDRLATSAVSPLNPAGQRAAALEQYQDTLAKAKAGDQDALGSLTDYADRLLQADRAATSSAQDRLALYNQVTGDVEALIAAQDTHTVSTTSAVQENTAATIQVGADIIAALQAQNAPAGGSSTSAMVSASSSLDASLEDHSGAVAAAMDGVGRRVDAGMAALRSTFEDRTNSLQRTLAAAISGLADVTDAQMAPLAPLMAKMVELQQAQHGDSMLTNLQLKRLAQQ